MRSVIELAGMNDVTAKILSRSKNPLNNARVAIKALSMIRPESAAYKDAAAGKMTAESTAKAIRVGGARADVNKSAK